MSWLRNPDQERRHHWHARGRKQGAHSFPHEFGPKLLMLRKAPEPISAAKARAVEHLGYTSFRRVKSYLFECLVISRLFITDDQHRIPGRSTHTFQQKELAGDRRNVS